ncbi:MAG: L,D-transpeptidase family protein [Gammaproteobacteria bacterium]|nr:L,D-transpeptidase family protein [Gammaproteobacteria bacterium]MBU1653768.1 L,D-transpeptidase family protein [Gammaproteobacteria bacterium]MBU1962691.1 L,D-transpeptidase family protein [Gammaproteobacteria bacterium]
MCNWKGAIVLTTAILASSPAQASLKADRVIVNKAERQLLLMRRGKVFKQFKVALGGKPVGHKQREGDQRTPEGRYLLDEKKADSAFYKAIHISYPSERDRLRARREGSRPGGAIMIHGQKNGFAWLDLIAQNLDWTRGCIAVRNEEMDEIWAAVDAGTPIQINP